MKCETPARASGSSREPAPIQKPSATERTPGTRSEMTRSPVASSVSWCFATSRDRSPLLFSPPPTCFVGLGLEKCVDADENAQELGREATLRRGRGSQDWDAVRRLSTWRLPV